MGNVMFRVRVHKIESIRDLDGNLGKRIELIEDRQIPSFVLRPQTEEAKVVQDVECESLGIEFDVNQIYDINLENQSLRFTKTA
jgi:hydroxypyruvate isomerase